MSEARVVTEDDQEFTRFPVPRLLNKRVRARLSDQPLPWESNKGAFCVNIRFGWFAAVTCQSGNYEVVLSPLSQLRQELSGAADEVKIPSQRTLPLGNSHPLKVFFACSDSVLVVAFKSGTLRIYEQVLSSDNSASSYSEVQTPYELLDAIPNSSSSPETAARVALVGSGGNLDLLNVQTKSIDNFTNGATAAAWSRDGQALAVGSSDGLLSVCPLSQGSSSITFPSFQQGLFPIWSVTWITDMSLHITARSPTNPSADAVNAIATINSAGAPLDIVNIATPWPDRDNFWTFAVALPQWLTSPGTSAGAVLVTGDICADTIEVFANLDGQWCQRTAENPLQIPLGDEGENVLLAMQADNTSSESIRFEVNGEGKDFPPSPILIAYLSDGTLQAWYLAHSSSYPGISSGEEMGAAAQAGATTVESTLETEMTTQPASTASVASPDTTPKPAAAASPSPSTFNQPTTNTPAFGHSSFGTSSFGKPAFGQSAFGHSGFSSGSVGLQQTTPTFGQSAFGAFASKPAAFGSTGFGFAAASSPSAFGKPAIEAPPMESAISAMSVSEPNLDVLSMIDEDTSTGAPTSQPGASAFGSFSQPSGQGSAFGTSAFGPSSSTPSFGNQTSPLKPSSGFGAFGGSVSSDSSFLKPSVSSEGSVFKAASGFGAFGGSSSGSLVFSSPSSQATPSDAAVSPPHPTAAATSAFGRPSFGSSSFGQPGFSSSSSSAFGAKSTFGQSSAFGAFASNASTPASGQPSTSSGGFGAFAAKPTTFSSALPKDDKPQKDASTTPAKSPEEHKSSTTPFGTPSSSTFGQPHVSGTPSKTAKAAASSKPPGVDSPPSSPIASTSPESAPSTPHKQPSFAQSTTPATTPTTGFGAFGQPKPSGGGFGSFGTASKTADTTGNSTAAQASGGFGAFTQPNGASGTAFSPFGTAAKISTSEDTASKSTAAPVSGGFGAFAQPKGTSPFGAFGQAPATSPQESAGAPSSKPSFGFGAFGGLTASTSAFGSFGNSAQPATPEPASKSAGLSSASGSTPPIFGAPSVFGNPSPTKPSAQPPAFGQSTSSYFGKQASSTSATPSSPKSVFGPVTPVSPSHADEEEEDVGPESEPEDDASDASDDEVSDDGSQEEGQRQDDHDDASDQLSLGSSEEDRLSVVEEEEETDEEAENEQKPTEADDGQSREDARLPSNLTSQPTSDQAQKNVDVSPTTRVSQIPLPVSRSPSVEKVPASPSEKEQPVERSTTPPGSPIKVQAPTPQKPSPTLPPSTPFGLGAGRPNTRPTRSSPLASAPMSRLDDEADERTAAPKEADEVKVKEEPLEPIVNRVKTPPLLFAPKPAASEIALKKEAQPQPKIGAPLFSPQSNAQSTFKLPVAPASSSTDTKPSIDSRKLTPPAMTGFGGFVTGGQSPFSLAPPVPVKASTPAISSPSPAPSTFSLSSPATKASPTAAPLLPSAKSPFSLAPPAPVKATPPAAPSAQSPFGLSPTTPIKPSAPAQEGSPASERAALSAHKNPPPETGLQAECAHVFALLSKELENLRTMVEEARKKGSELPPGDQMSAYKGAAAQIKTHLDEFGAHSKQVVHSLARVESDMLKATTRREEANRFSEAKRDGDFSKMLKFRTLSPDHIESQKQLRSSINAVRDRIEKLESHLAASKAKLNRSRTEKAGLKAPSLDTINRTCRNIDIAIDFQKREVDTLTSRLSSLRLENNPKTPSRDSRLPDPVSRPFNVTPHVAFTTAAALNAERAAQKCKHAMLAARSEPLLNRSAATTPNTAVSFSTPQKLTTPDTSPSVPDFSNMVFEDFANSKFEPSTSPTAFRRGASGARKHNVIPLKRTTGVQQPATPPSFQWGPLPFTSTPKSPTPLHPFNTASPR